MRSGGRGRSGSVSSDRTPNRPSGRPSSSRSVFATNCRPTPQGVGNRSAASAADIDRSEAVGPWHRASFDVVRRLSAAELGRRQTARPPGASRAVDAPPSCTSRTSTAGTAAERSVGRPRRGHPRSCGTMVRTSHPTPVAERRADRRGTVRPRARGSGTATRSGTFRAAARRPVPPLAVDRGTVRARARSAAGDRQGASGTARSARTSPRECSSPPACSRRISRS